jgi:hypothetical protein
VEEEISESHPVDGIVLGGSPEAQLAKAEAIREVVLGQSDLKGTYREYAKLTGLQQALRQYKGKSDAVLFEVTLIRREAERKMGQLLMEIPRHPGARSDLTSSVRQIRLYGDILKDLHIKSDSAHKWQQVAQYPEDEFRALVESRKTHLKMGKLVPITLEELLARVSARDFHTKRQAQKQAEKREHKEILEKATVLAESIPSYEAFQKQVSGLTEAPLEYNNYRTLVAVQKLARKHYQEELEQRRRESINYTIGRLREMKQAIIHLSKLQEEGLSFRELATDVKQRMTNQPKDFYQPVIVDVTDFTIEDVRMAIAYLEEVARELEAHEQN